APARPAKSGGCTAPATGPRSRLRRSHARCWRGWPGGTGTFATAARGQAMPRGAITRPRGAFRRPALPPRACRAPPTLTSAGRAPSMADVSAALAGMGIDRVHTEIFGAAPGITPGIAAGSIRPPHLPPGEPGTGPQVAFARSGLTVPWGPGYASLLELAEAC